MKIRDFRAKSFLMFTACLVLFLFAGCGGGGRGGGGNGTSYISISGKITFDFVPATQTSGLDYSSTTQKPARGVVVEAIRASDSAILNSTTTDSSGNYTVSVPVNTDIIIRVKAQMLKSGIPSWDFQVVDNTNSKALYVMDSASFNSGTANITDKNLNAPSGWGGSSYISPRVAAPFAILDTVYKAFQKIITVDPTVSMPQLLINWSVDNEPTEGDETSGQIGTSYYDPTEKQLYILGAEGNDTDEYDDHVIAHEWGHYFEDRFSRSDSMGGDHSSGNKLDPRVAFSEGFSNAFSGIATDDQYYIDTSGSSQGTIGVFIDLENNNSDTLPVGWFSEESVQRILYDLYDLYDSTNDGVDTISLGFSPIYDVLVNNQKNTDSFTTIFSFTLFLKNNYAGNSTMLAGINNLLEKEIITTTAIDEWDSTGTETNDGGNPKSLPVYTKLTAGNPAVRLCGDGQFGNYNKLMNRRFFYFVITSSGSYSITAVPDVNGDPVINLYSQRLTVGSADNGDNGVTETLTVNLTPGYYVGEIYDWRHVNTFFYITEKCFYVSLN